MLAERKEQEAARQLGELQRQLTHEQAQLEELQFYRQEYLNDYSQAQTDLNTLQRERLSSFIFRLADVIEVQQQKLLTLQQQLEVLRQQWQLCHHQRKAIADLIERLLRTEDNEAERQLQKLMDDMTNTRPR